MNHSDEAIDKVLAGLRSAEAPLGMNRRIFEGAQARAAASSPSAWFGINSRWIRASKFPILACGVLIVIAVAWPKNHRLAPDMTYSKRTLAVPASPLLAKVEEPADSPTLTLSNTPLQAAILPKRRRARGVRSSGSTGLSDTQAASFPAPPMPLTDQEKLLLRIVHKGDPVEMAMLDPDVRSRRNVEGKAEFQRFFEAPTQGDTP